MTLVSKVKELLDAIAEWQNVDCDVGDNGWTDENEGAWDDARGRMFRLKDEVRAELENGGDKVVVVTISEMLPVHGNEVDTMVFSDFDKAEAWVEAQIDSYVQSYGLDRETAVDGWYLRIDGDLHTIQYDAKVKDVR